MKKRMFSLCMALILCLGLLPVNVLGYEIPPNFTFDWRDNILVGDQLLSCQDSASPVYATTSPDGTVTVLEDEPTSEDEWTIQWDGSTLTLKDATVQVNTTFEATWPSTHYYLAPVIRLSDGVTTIVLSGDNQLIGQLTDDPIYSSTDLAGICVKGDLVIQGPGTLTAESSALSTGGGRYFVTSAGIISQSGNVTIENRATVTASGAAIGNGSNPLESAGICAEYGTVTISDSTVTATGDEVSGSDSADSYGIYGTDVSISNSTVTASSGAVNTSSYAVPCSNGIRFSSSVTISGDTTLTATGNDATKGSSPGYSQGIYNFSAGSIQVTPPDGEAVLLWTGEDCDHFSKVPTEELITGTSPVSQWGLETYVRSEVVDPNASFVTGVSITPGTSDAPSVAAGGTLPFTAQTTGIGPDVKQAVTWSVENNTSSGTFISQDGLLTVAENEKANPLTVKATPQDDHLPVFGTVDVTVTSSVTGVTIQPESSTVSVGETQQFTAQVSGTGDFDDSVEWTVSGCEKGQTTISPSGKLTVAEDETATTLTVTATSQANPDVFDTATVTVTHAHKGDLVQGIPATCTASGEKDYYQCSICGLFFADEECREEIKAEELDAWKVISPTGHSWSEYQMKDTNYHSRTCSNCHQEEQELHMYADEQDGSCEVCEYTRWYTITFDANGGTVSPLQANTVNGTLADLPTPTRDPADQYIFLGWYTQREGGNPVTKDMVYQADTTIYAHWQEKIPPVLTVNVDPSGAGSCLVLEITSDLDEDNIDQLKPEPIKNGTYTAKEYGSQILLIPQAAPGYIYTGADYVKLPGDLEDTVSFATDDDAAYISVETQRNLTVNLTFREAEDITVGNETLPSNGISYATTDPSGQVTLKPSFTEQDAWNIKWDSDNAVLTLRDATIQGIQDRDGSSFGIFYESNISIVLQGENQVTSADTDITDGSTVSLAILSKGNLSFSGSGSLTATAGTSATSIGILAEGSMTFEDDVVVKASSADVSVTQEINVNVHKWSGQSSGLFALNSLTVQDEADVTGTGGKYTVSGTTQTNIGMSIGCGSVMQMNIQGGKLTATAQESKTIWHGILTGSLVISGGEISASGHSAISDDVMMVTVVPPAGKRLHVLDGSTEIAGSPFTQETKIDPELFLSITTLRCYLDADPSHQHLFDQWKYDETNHWHTCLCGEAAGDAAPHVFADDADTTCDVCGYERQVTPPVGTEYTVTFDANGGSVTPDSAVTTDGKLTSLPTPTKSGYDFMGWYTQAVGGQAVTVNTVFTQDTTIYAQWKEQDSGSGGSGGSSGGDSDPTYSVSLPGNVKGGEVSAKKRYAEAGETFRFTVTPDEGYELDTLTVTDSRGRELDLDYKSGEYSFKMPAGQVKIQASFREIVSQTEPLPFTDVAENTWYTQAVRYVYEKGLMSGTSATVFSPNATTSRSMIATILWRMAGSPVVDYAMDFSDVPQGQWYSEAIRWAASQGIVSGYGDTFGTNDPITREQLAVMLYRFAQVKGYDVSVGENTNILSYTDVEDVAEYAIPAMQWAVGAGVITGTGDGSTLSPKGQATRAQAAVMLYSWLS